MITAETQNRGDRVKRDEQDNDTRPLRIALAILFILCILLNPLASRRRRV
jgi:hypothetical protein